MVERLAFVLHVAMSCVHTVAYMHISVSVYAILSQVFGHTLTWGKAADSFAEKNKWACQLQREYTHVRNTSWTCVGI